MRYLTGEIVAPPLKEMNFVKASINKITVCEYEVYIL